METSDTPNNIFAKVGEEILQDKDKHRSESASSDSKFAKIDAYFEDTKKEMSKLLQHPGNAGRFGIFKEMLSQNDPHKRNQEKLRQDRSLKGVQKGLKT